MPGNVWVSISMEKVNFCGHDACLNRKDFLKAKLACELNQFMGVVSRWVSGPIPASSL